MSEFPTPPIYDGTDLKIETPEVFLTIKRQPDGDGSAYIFAVRTRGALEVQDIFAASGSEKLAFVIGPQGDGKNRHFIGVYPIGRPGANQLIEIQTPGS